MKKINVKVTAFLGVIVLAVVVLLLNLVEFRRTVGKISYLTDRSADCRL